MAFRDGAYATVWEVKPTRGASKNVRISTSYKDKQSGQYLNDFGEYVFFSGDAAKKADTLKEKDRIKLKGTSVTSQWDKEKKTNHYTFVVWDFEPADQGGAPSGGKKAQGSVVPPKAPATAADDDDGLPF